MVKITELSSSEREEAEAQRGTYLSTHIHVPHLSKPSNCNNLRILLVYSRHTDSHVFWGHLRQTYCQHSLHRQTLLLVGSHAAPPPFGTVFPHLYALLTVSLVLGLSSRLTCSPDICSRSTVRASDTLIPGLSSVINSLLTYLLTLVLNLGVVFWGEFSRIISIVSGDLATHPQDPAGRRPLPYLAFSFTVSY